MRIGYIIAAAAIVVASALTEAALVYLLVTRWAALDVVPKLLFLAMAVCVPILPWAFCGMYRDFCALYSNK